MSQFLQVPGMHVIGSHRFGHIQSYQLVFNFLFAKSRLEQILQKAIKVFGAGTLALQEEAKGIGLFQLGEGKH